MHTEEVEIYHPHDVYFTKVGTCDNRGAEALWQFQLFPEVEQGLIGEWVDNTNDVHENEDNATNDAHGHEWTSFSVVRFRAFIYN